jgi:CIC family chloride channel protein
VTRGDLLRALQRDPSGSVRVLDAGSTKLVVAYPDELLHDAIARMLKNDIGRLPVVSRENPRQLVGYLGRSSVMVARARYLEEEELREHSSIADLLPMKS